jgi:rubrerythrin
MINNFRRTLFAAALAAVLGLVALMLASPAVAASKAKTSKTLENLQAAYRSESNAQARYVAFAQQADKEGYGEVASLFRAAARAEEIELHNDATVIKKMGAEPQAAEIKPAAIKSTRENLIDAASKGDAYDSSGAYPRFVKQAKAAGNADAATFFFYAQTSAAQHGILFQKALANLENMKGKSRTYYVCATCGYTTEKPRPQGCETCSGPAENYEAVN